VAKYPALPLWTDALIADTTHLSHSEFGIYMRILIAMWRTPGCRIPKDKKWLCVHFDQPIEIIDSTFMPIFREFCQNAGKWLIQKRLQKEYQFVARSRQKNGSAAKARWDKEKIDAPTPTPNISKKEKIENLDLKAKKARKQKTAVNFSPRITPELLRRGATATEMIAKAEATRELIIKAEPFMAAPGSPEFEEWFAYAERDGKKLLVKFLNDHKIKNQPFSFISKWPPDHPANGKAAP
jgi:uncharacterized protein YdaU (DUF1376 family)